MQSFDNHWSGNTRVSESMKFIYFCHRQGRNTFLPGRKPPLAWTYLFKWCKWSTGPAIVFVPVHVQHLLAAHRHHTRQDTFLNQSNTHQLHSSTALISYARYKYGRDTTMGRLSYRYRSENVVQTQIKQITNTKWKIDSNLCTCMKTCLAFVMHTTQCQK